MKPFLPLKLLVAVIVVFASSQALANSHSYINNYRSGIYNHVFVQQSVEGEFGSYSTKGTRIGESGAGESYSEGQDWKGYGIGTSVGLEVMKFIQFSLGHTFVNMQHKDDRLESLSGSRLNAGLKLVFGAPIFNLEVGTGLTGSRLDYQKQLENASFYGSGLYNEISLNHYMSSQISVYFSAKLANEHLARTAGSSSVKDMDTSTTLMGAGVRIWL
jgi:hypothetical protein